MTTFKVFVRAVGADVAVPPLFANDNVAGSPVVSAFGDGSNGLITLEIDRSLLNQPYAEDRLGEEVSAFYLHKATRVTLKNPLDRKVNRIALLLSNRYTYRQALGVMFDRGFATVDDPADPKNQRELVGTPREACAVFLDAIRELRAGAPDRDFDREVLFNCVHELGHVFNLQHCFAKPNFLTNSPPRGKLPDNYDSYRRFADSHLELLRESPIPVTTWPGGSDFADHGMYASHSLPSHGRRTRRLFGLDLRIDLRRHSIAYFDPIELDVEIRVLPSVARRFRLLDQIDPGYGSFRVWIEEPDGERRLYRCPRHYCRPQRTLTISPARSFRRDISIFGQSGGYTFRRAGLHRLWVEFDPGSDPPLHSNAVELEILPMSKLDRAARECRALFTSRVGKVMLYHRVDDTGGRTAKRFLAFAKQYPRSALAVEASYAVARARAMSLSALTGDERAALVSDTLPILQRLAGSAVLSDHKRTKCESLLQLLFLRRRSSQFRQS